MNWMIVLDDKYLDWRKEKYRWYQNLRSNVSMVFQTHLFCIVAVIDRNITFIWTTDVEASPIPLWQNVPFLFSNIVYCTVFVIYYSSDYPLDCNWQKNKSFFPENTLCGYRDHSDLLHFIIIIARSNSTVTGTRLVLHYLVSSFLNIKNLHAVGLFAGDALKPVLHSHVLLTQVASVTQGCMDTTQIPPGYVSESKNDIF